jgi:transcriptional regulator with XRE-family HTH domain
MGLRQYELAAKASISPPYISWGENGRFVFDQKQVARLCKALDCEASDVTELQNSLDHMAKMGEGTVEVSDSA